jgi:hypothetical protein
MREVSEEIAGPRVMRLLDAAQFVNCAAVQLRTGVSTFSRKVVFTSQPSTPRGLSQQVGLNDYN